MRRGYLLRPGAGVQAPCRWGTLLALVALTAACATEAGGGAALSGGEAAGDDVASAPADGAAGGADAGAGQGVDGGLDGVGVDGASDAAAATEDPGGAGQDAAATDVAPADAAAEDDAGGSVDAEQDTGDAAPGWGPALCPATSAKVGFAIGDQLGPITVVDCDTGAPRSLDELCGAQALWLFVAHSHCPTCRATAGLTPTIAAALAPIGVAVAHVLYIDDGQTCPQWREKYGLSGAANVRVYEDPTGAAWQAIKLYSTTAPHLFANAARVVTHKQHGLSSAGVKAQAQKALASN